jgi:hypothetical protein
MAHRLKAKERKQAKKSLAPACRWRDEGDLEDGGKRWRVRLRLVIAPSASLACHDISGTDIFPHVFARLPASTPPWAR